MDLVGGVSKGCEQGSHTVQSSFLERNQSSRLFCIPTLFFDPAQHLRNTLTGSATVLDFPSPKWVLSLAVAMQSALPVRLLLHQASC